MYIRRRLPKHVFLRCKACYVPLLRNVRGKFGGRTLRPPRSKTELHRHPSRGASLPRRRLLSRRNKAAAPHGRSVARVEAGKWELGILRAHGAAQLILSFSFLLESESNRFSDAKSPRPDGLSREDKDLDSTGWARKWIHLSISNSLCIMDC
jgi:hypothetical protein